MFFIKYKLRRGKVKYCHNQKGPAIKLLIVCVITRFLESKRLIVTFSYVTFMFYCPSSKSNTKISDCSQRTPTRISAEARAVLSGTSLQQQQGQSGSCHRSCNHIASRLLDVLLYSNNSNTPIIKYKFSYIVKKMLLVWA